MDVSSALEPLIREVQHELMAEPMDLADLKASLERLLAFLSGEEGRTDQNCVAVTFFFDNYYDWRKDWSHLPEEFQEIFDDLGKFLKYTFADAEAARKYKSTPEQLLERIKELSL
ncbi:MAG: hypothetical protein ACYTG7_25185 [Planctomycetota bacterium]